MVNTEDSASCLDVERVSEQTLRRLSFEALRRFGVPEGPARDTAEILVLGDLFGLSTHGVRRIFSYTERIAGGGIRGSAEPRTERLTASLGRVDGGNGLGPAAGRAGLRLAIELARETGLAAVFVRNSAHFGAISPYCWLAAQEGLATIIMSNATPTIAPTGGRATRLGNNPIGIGFPRPGHFPFILDMALSVSSRAKIRDAAAAGQPIPPGWATDNAGQPTTDPAAALKGFLLPAGGHKGYGLSLAVDMFAGLLSGASFLTGVGLWSEPATVQNVGHLFIALDPNRLLPAADYELRIAEFAAIIHNTPAADPSAQVMLPGEREGRRMAENREMGVAVDREVIQHLKEIAP